MDKRRVLVVEDDSHLLSGIRDILELEDYKVLTAKNGHDGLTVLQSDPDNPPDVIVSDIMMPHMDGFEFLEEVRKEDRWVTVPFIFLTAKGGRTDQYKGARMGADHYITKPFDAEHLLVTVDSVLRRVDNIERVKKDELSGLKRRMMTLLNHEFRTPLTLVVAYSEMLKEFDPSTMEEDEVMTFLHGVNSGADRLRRLVENFMTVVDLENDEAQKTIGWRSRPVEDLRLIIDDALRQVMMPIQRPREFITHFAPSLPTVNIDVQYMTIAIRELLDNAAKFSDADDKITIDVQELDGFVEITIQDQGRGIPEAELEHIWDPFYQIDREQFEDQGAGSGLAIVDGVIRLHGGTRHVESVHGEGSIFTIRIPVHR